MAASKAAIRYATALLDLSEEMGNLEKVNEDIVLLDSLCDTNRDLLAFFHSPIIQTRRKLQVYDALFKGKIEEVSLKFLKQVTKNKRENILPEITESFIKQYKKRKGILEVYVKSAVALENKVKDAIKARVKRHFEGEIEMHETIDQSLIGGFVVSVENEQIDASIKSQLANLKNILLN